MAAQISDKGLAALVELVRAYRAEKALSAASQESQKQADERMVMAFGKPVEGMAFEFKA